jgi:hypothetical protein
MKMTYICGALFVLLAIAAAGAFLGGFWSQGIGLLILLGLVWLLIQVV